VPSHPFTLVLQRDVPLTGADLIQLRRYGCVLVTRDADGRDVAVFETESEYFPVVEAAIAAVEALGHGGRVLEITGEPAQLEGTRLRTTVTREQWDGQVVRSAERPGWMARVASSRYRWWPVYAFCIVLTVVVLFGSSRQATVMLSVGVGLSVLLLGLRVFGVGGRRD
jgi:hypothetical protein